MNKISDDAQNTDSSELTESEEPISLPSKEIETNFGEPLHKMLDLDTWKPGEDLVAMYGRLEAEVEAAVRQENRIHDRIRTEVFPRLSKRPGAPPSAGVYRATVDQIEKIHRGFLFNGAVEACDGTSVVHDTLPLTIVQIGVCLVSYHGDQGSWVHRLFRRDLRTTGIDPIEETLQILERRQKRAGFDRTNPRDQLTDLARRGMMTYAERAVLLKKSNALWRMGHGSPTPYELLTGSGSTELLSKSLDLLRDFLLNHKRFIFVPSGPAERMLLTIGNALQPLEYAIIDTMEETIDKIASGHYRGKWSDLLTGVKAFAKDVGTKVIIGIYRASAIAPPQIFYAHSEYAHEAALIVLADSALQEHRGFPTLIDLANTVCDSTFGGETLTMATQLAYTEAGAPFRYLPERKTRS